MADENDDVQEARAIGKYRDRILSGPVVSTLLRLGIPPLINQLIVIGYNVLDSYWLSLYEEVDVAVPRQVRPVIMLFDALLNGLTAACLSIVSQYIGSKNFKDASRSASRFFTAAFTIGLIQCTLLLTLKEYIFTWVISTPPEIFGDVMKYSAVVSFDVFFNSISFTYLTLLQSIGDTKRPAIINFIGIGINTLLDPFLVLGIGPFPRLGVIGASLTDVMGKIISIIGFTYIIRRSYPELRVRFTRDIDLEWVRLVLRIGIPVMILGLTNGFAFLAQLKIINLLGIVAAAAYSIGFIVMDIVDGALWGLSGANAIMVGQNLGAGNNERAREVSYKTALLLFGLVAATSSLVYPIRVNIIEAFAQDPNTVAETELFVRILLPTLPFFGIFMTAMSTGRGSGHTTYPTLIGIIRLWAIRVGLGYLLAFPMGMGTLGVWLSLALSNVVAGVVAIIWIRYEGWAKAVIKREA